MKRFVLLISLMVGGACGMDGGALTDSSTASESLPRVSPLVNGLTVAERARAIAARSRAARQFKAPTETIFRRYSNSGEVLEERVQVDGQWRVRPSTLPPELTRRPLASFVGNHATVSIYSSLPSTWVRSASDTTLDGQDFAMTADTVWSFPGYQISVKESPALPGATLVGDLYYADSADVGNVSLTQGAATVTMDAVGDEFVEDTWEYWDWVSVKNSFLAIIDPYLPALRTDPMFTPTVAESTDNVIHTFAGTTVLASQFSAAMMQEKTNCAGYRHSAKGFLGLALLGGALAVGVVACPVCTFGYVAAATSLAGKAALTGVLGFVVQRGAYHSCQNT